MQKEKKRRQSPNEISFYIIGNRRLENELIASYLNQNWSLKKFILKGVCGFFMNMTRLISKNVNTSDLQNNDKVLGSVFIV